MRATALLVLLLCATEADAQRTIIRAARMLDVASGRITRDAVVVIEGGRIRSVGGNVTPTAADAVVDLPNHTLLPGLIDAHVHLSIGAPPRQTAVADLRAGFTTVVDLGGRTPRLARIKDSINAGFIEGPRVLAAGLWIGRQGGVCEFGGLGIAGGIDAYRTRVRENVENGAEVIKACVSGWPAAAFANPNDYEMPDSVLRAIVDESNKLKRKVIAHDISLGGVRAALAAGVAGLAHAAYVDSATAVRMRTQGMFMISTLTSLTGGGADTSAASRALFAATGLAYRVGVPIVFGTDGGVLPHGDNAREFASLTRAGLTPIDAIRAATINAARAFGIADSIGVIAPGMVADLVAVDGDPLADVSNLQRVRFVMSRGRVQVSP